MVFPRNHLTLHTLVAIFLILRPSPPRGFFCYPAADMKPAPFRYVAARSLEQALALKAEYGDEARFLAGGQSLVPTMNFRLTQPEVLIDINPLKEFAGVRRNGADRLRIGALTRYRSLERDSATAREPAAHRRGVAAYRAPAIRNRGTIGGNLAHADPASEMPAIVLTLGGRLRAQSVRGERWIEAADFFVGALTTALAPDEMLMEVELPVAQPRAGACFMELARRRGDFAIIGVAARCASTPKDAAAKRASACATPAIRRSSLPRQAMPFGERVERRQIEEAAAIVQRSIEPGGNVHASNEYQRHIAGVLTARALACANERAGRGTDTHDITVTVNGTPTAVRSRRACC